MGRPNKSSGRGCLFQPAEQANRLIAAITANFRICIKSTTDSRTARIAEQLAEILDGQMQTTLSGWLSRRHARNRGTDGWCNATSTAAWAAEHGERPRTAGMLEQTRILLGRSRCGHDPNHRRLVRTKLLWSFALVDTCAQLPFVHFKSYALGISQVEHLIGHRLAMKSPQA